MPSPPFRSLQQALAAAGAAALGAWTLLGSAAAPAQPAASFYGTRFSVVPTPAALTALGRTLFFDPSLSASGRLACASCHDPAHAYGPPNALAVQRGGARMEDVGVRAVPSLRYLQNVPPFTEHYHEDEGDDSIDQGPAGGRTWDGRAQSAHDQARLPLLSPFEMANAGPQQVVDKVRAAHRAEFERTFGSDVFEDPQRAFNAVLLALEVFQQDPAEFYPYSSKYDAVLRRRATLDDAERRGLALFNDPAKGNCAACHPSAMREGALPAFTDFGYIALGVPRNAAIPANADPAYHDLGLCGPLRQDLADRVEYCGLFRTPSLRNVATRQVFFHNGAAHGLSDAVKFYVERDTHPERWYPRDRRGEPRKFDDLPPRYHENVNDEAPFGRPADGKPVLSDDEIADVVAFLRTLSDGYVPAAAASAASAATAANARR